MNKSVQHVVNTVEVEKPKLVKETVQEKINQVTKHIKTPQVQFLNKVDDMLVDVQRQIPVAQTMQKTMEVPPSHVTDKVSDIPVVAPKQIVPMAQTVQKTTEIPQLQFPDQAVDVPVVLVAQVPQLLSDVQAPTMQVVEKTVEIPQLQTVEKIGETPQTQIIQSARTSESSVTAPVCQTTQVEIGEVIEIGASIPAESASPVLVTAPVLENSPVVVGSEQPAHVAEYMTLEPIVSEIRDLKSDLVHIRELLGVLVRKERSAEAKAEIAARRLNRMEATLEEALADHSKVVKVIVDKWFVDKGFGFGKTPTGQVVFIHASAVQGAEVLKIGTDARVEVVNDDARAQGGVQSQTCLGTRRVESG